MRGLLRALGLALVLVASARIAAQSAEGTGPTAIVIEGTPGEPVVEESTEAVSERLRELHPEYRHSSYDETVRAVTNAILRICLETPARCARGVPESLIRSTHRTLLARVAERIAAEEAARRADARQAEALPGWVWVLILGGGAILGAALFWARGERGARREREAWGVGPPGENDNDRSS